MTSLEGLSVDLLAEMYGRSQDDFDRLVEINEVLKLRNSDAANHLQMELALRLGQLRKLRRSQDKGGGERGGIHSEVGRAGHPPVPARDFPGSTISTIRKRPKPTPVRDFFALLFARHGIERPDERPLCLYRLGDAEFERVTVLLRSLCRAGRLHQPDARSGALFVLYGAEWFRRRSTGGTLRWADLAPDIVGQLNQAQRAELTERGLHYWKRPLRRSQGARELLLSLALEGGIPLHAVLEGGEGWLRSFLSNLMRRALLEDINAENEIVSLAEDEQHRLVEGYRDEDFLVLCSQLICAVLHWRKIALDRSKSLQSVAVDPVALLDIVQPDWRSDIPIHVPIDGAEIITSLINGLVRDPGTGQLKGEIGAKRLLLKELGGWKPALQLSSDGTLPLSRLKDIHPNNGRGRVVPAGELARQMSGAFALLEPPGEEERTWRVRPLVRLNRPIKNFPFTSPVAAEVVQDGTRTSLVWPGGRAVLSELLVFAEEPVEAGAQQRLGLVGTGSVQSNHKQLFIAVPPGWSASDTTGTSPVAIGSVPDIGLDLMQIDQPTRVKDGSTGDTYLVEPGATPVERAMEPSGRFLGAVRPDEPKTLLFTGALTINISEGRKLRPPLAGEVFWRRQAGELFDVTRTGIPEGFLDILWRDPESGIQRDRLQVGVLPPTAEISGRLETSNGIISVQGFSGWRVSVVGVSSENFVSFESRFEIQFAGAPPYLQKIRLTPPRGRSFCINVPLHTRNGSLVLADSSIAEPGTRLALHDLRGAYFVAPHKVRLDARLRASRTPANTALDLPIEGELPLTQLGPLFRQLLSLVPDQDAIVELTIRGQSGRPWVINHTRLERLSIDNGVASGIAPASARVMAQSIHRPGEELELQQDSATTWKIPPELEAPGLIYLREGGQVVSRPALLYDKANTAESEGMLVAALSEPQYGLRQELIYEAIMRFGNGIGPKADAGWLRAAAVGLNGLTPTAFDALAALPRVPRALIRLLVESRDDAHLEAIWGLERELPFAWAGLAISDWRHVIESYFQRLESELTLVFPADEAMKMALETIEAKGQRLSALDSTLMCILKRCGMGFPGTATADGQIPLGEIMQAHMRRMVGIDGEGRFDFPQSGVERAFKICSDAGATPPAEFAPQRVHDFFRGTLIAPFLLAVAARRAIVLQPEELWLVRRAMHLDPDYVAAGYAYFLPIVA